MDAAPRVAVVIPVHNHLAQTLRCLDSLRAVRYANFSVVVVDDGSRDGTSQKLAERYPEVTVLRGGGNLWWAGATNRGVRHALARDSRYVLTLNNDTRVHPDVLTHLVSAAADNPRGIIGSRINFLARPTRVWALGAAMRWQDGRIFHLLEQGEEETAPHVREPELRAAETLTGCGTLVPADCFRECGYYDARRYPQYHADAEFVLRAAKYGYRALVHSRAVVWNDAANTAAGSATRLFDQLLSRRSAAFLRPVLAIHRDYCPPRWFAASLAQYYARYFLNHDIRLRRLGALFKSLTR